MHTPRHYREKCKAVVMYHNVFEQNTLQGKENAISVLFLNEASTCVFLFTDQSREYWISFLIEVVIKLMHIIITYIPCIFLILWYCKCWIWLRNKTELIKLNFNNCIIKHICVLIYILPLIWDYTRLLYCFFTHFISLLIYKYFDYLSN